MSTQYGAGPPWGPEGRAALVANEKRRPSKAAPSKTPISATGNQGSYTRPRNRVQALPFGASILDRLLAADVAALIQRNPREFAAVLAEIGDQLGIRGSLEDRLGPAARLDHAKVWPRR